LQLGQAVFSEARTRLKLVARHNKRIKGVGELLVQRSTTIAHCRGNTEKPEDRGTGISGSVDGCG